MKNKKSLLLLIVLAVVLIGTVGLTYALYSRTIIGSNTELVAGDIYMHYNETKEVTISNLMPSATYSEDQTPFEFNITGKNTNSDNDIWYEIVLTRGDVPDGKQEENRIDDKYLKFTLIETKSVTEGEPVNETVVNAKTYKDLSEGERIWVNEIPRETLEETKISYKLYMWISDAVKVGNTSEAVYSADEWNDIFASVKIKVTGDFEEKELKQETTAADTLIEKVDSEEDGVEGIDPETGLACIPGGDCKEYRYTGPTVKNYVKLKNKQTTGGEDTEELWRIIGIFTDSETSEKYMRIVRNEVLPEAMLPTNYVKNGTTYTIHNSSYYAYWNKNDSGTQKNTWESAGLQYYLNTEQDESENKGYMSYLSEETKGMLEERTHYLGSFMWNTDTAVSGYQHERDVQSCIENKGAASSFPTEGCNVWSGNDATWKGKVSLMYPSDYGFSGDKQYWIIAKLYGSSSASEGTYRDTAVNGTSWMFTTMPDAQIKRSWMLSPSSEGSIYAVDWNWGGYVLSHSVGFNGSGVRPVLNLKSQVKIVSGEGTEELPYILEI